VAPFIYTLFSKLASTRVAAKDILINLSNAFAAMAAIDGMHALLYKYRIIFLVGYVIFLVCLFEGAARLAFLIPTKRLQANEDYTYRRNWVDQHQRFMLEAYYSFDVYDPSCGWRTKPNVRDLRVFDNKILNTNSKGERGKRDFPYNNNRQMLRILVLGDSFTFGDEVSDDETYSFYLQEMLPQTEIINMGAHGYGHDQMLILLREEGIKYQPDIVILGFLGLDMSRNLLSFRDFAKPRFVLERGRLKLTGVPVPSPEEILEWDWARPRIIDIFSLLSHSVKKFTGIQKQEMRDVTTAILKEMINVIESAHAIPILEYLPRGKEITNKAAKTEDEAYLFSICQLNDKARCFSARPQFAAKIAKGERFKSGGHWDPAGHLVVAEAIRNHLEAEGFIAIH